MTPMDFVRFVRAPRPHALWEEFFGPYPWFYAPTAGTMLVKNGLKWVDVYNRARENGFRSCMYDIEFNRDVYSTWGQWNQISQLQFKRALGQELVRLDKAILTYCIVRDAIENNVHLKEIILEAIIVIPSTFIIIGLDRSIRGGGLVVEQLVKKTGQSRLFFDEVAHGGAMIESIAYDVVDACRDIGNNKVDVKLLKDRSNLKTGGLVRVVQNQLIDQDKMSAFYNIKM